MTVISNSGLYQNDFGENFLITQGVIGYTLVAGKQFLFRYFVDPVALAKIDSVRIIISLPGGTGTKGILVPKADLIFETTAPNGPSVGIIIRGFACPKAGNYGFLISCKDINLADVTPLASYNFNFLPTKDIRFMIVPIQGSAPSRNFLFSSAWVADLQKAMQRISCMFPVRDCVRNILNHNSKSGIRYQIAPPLEAWPQEVGQAGSDLLGATKQFNAAAAPGTDLVDVTIIYRPCQPALNESPGGNALYNGISQPFPQANLVGGFFAALNVDMTAPAIAQEVGHLFGLEPAGSPGFQDPNNPAHSKNSQVIDPYAFDFVNKKPFPTGIPNHFLRDTMNNLASGVWQGSDSVMYSPFDWEWMRKGIDALNNQSTGTEINPATTDTCGVHYLLPMRKTIALPPNQYLHLIGSRADGKLYKWGDHGFVPIDPKGDPDTPYYRNQAERVVKEFISLDVKEVYIPKDHEIMDITNRLNYSLHDGNTDLPGEENGHDSHKI